MDYDKVLIRLTLIKVSRGLAYSSYKVYHPSWELLSVSILFLFEGCKLLIALQVLMCESAPLISNIWSLDSYCGHPTMHFTSANNHGNGRKHIHQSMNHQVHAGVHLHIWEMIFVSMCPVRTHGNKYHLWSPLKIPIKDHRLFIIYHQCSRTDWWSLKQPSRKVTWESYLSSLCMSFEIKSIRDGFNEKLICHVKSLI